MRAAVLGVLISVIAASVLGGYLAGTGVHGTTTATTTATITTTTTLNSVTQLTSGAASSSVASSASSTENLNNNTTEPLAVYLTFLGATEPISANVTIVSYQPQSHQLCNAQPETPTTCSFGPDGYLDIDARLLRFDYLDLNAHGVPSNFTFDGVPFTNGVVSSNYCPPNRTCTGPAQACVSFSTPIVQNGTSRSTGGWGECMMAPFPRNLLYLDPRGSPLVGFLSVPDGSIYVLVLDK